MGDIKLGVVGTNFISEWLCKAVEACKGICVHAVYSRKMYTAEKFAERFDIPNTYDDYLEFLLSDIDAVYIASPNSLHYIQAKDALEHGKHVFVEKPACICEYEFEKLCAFAKENGLIIMEAMRPAHDPALKKAVEIAKSGAIGKVRNASIEYCQYSSRYDKFKSGEVLNAFNPSLGNAAIMDIGVYALHVAVMFFGEPNNVYSKSLKLSNGMEGLGNVLLDFEEIPVNVTYSKITESLNPSVITGEEGYIVLKRLSSTDEVAIVDRKNGEKRVIACANERPYSNMIYEVEDFVKAVETGKFPNEFNAETLNTLRIMDEVRKQNQIFFY